MEICGGQTHTIMRYGIDELLPRNIEIVHGPAALSVSRRLKPWTKPLPWRCGRTSSWFPTETCCGCRDRIPTCFAPKPKARTFVSLTRRPKQ